MFRRFLPKALFLTAAITLALPAFSQNAFHDKDWPRVTGPDGRNNAAKYGHDLVNDLILARLVWTSDAILGKVRSNPRDAIPPGSGSSPIIADGKVFVTTYRPAGDAEAEVSNRHGTAPEGAPIKKILSDDIVVAFDAKTGKLLWEAKEPGGITRPGFKRLDYSPAATYMNGVVYSVGTTGRVFAYDAKTGTKKWESAIPANEAFTKARDKALEAKQHVANAGDCLNSPIAVAGTLLVPDFGASYGSNGIVGFDADTGKQKFHLKSIGHHFVNPLLVTINGKPRVLAYNTGTSKGKLTCFDPADGKILWTLNDIGPLLQFAASDRTVMVNKRQEAKGLGIAAAYRFDDAGAKLAWSLPDNDEYGFEIRGDAAARRKMAIRDGIVYLNEMGPNKVRFIMLKEEDGTVLFDSGLAEKNKMAQTIPGHGTMRLFEDRILVAADEAHGGSKLPVAFSMWKIKPDGVEFLSANWDPNVEPATTYEVLLEWPYVDGYLYSRTLTGAIACYDLRKSAKKYERAELNIDNGYRGMVTIPLPMRLYFGDNKLLPQGASYPPDEKQAGLILGKDRRFTRWERVWADKLTENNGKVTGSIVVDHGTGTWPMTLDLTRTGDTIAGTWQRNVQGLETPVKVNGDISGKGAMPDRAVFTPWLPNTPWTSMGKNPDGTTTWMIQLNGVFKYRSEKNPGDLRIYIDWDGTKITRSLATALSSVTSWHEVDASKLTITKDGTIKGRLEVCLNEDRFVSFSPNKGSIGALFDIDLKMAGDQSLTGTYTGTVGQPVQWSGKVEGKLHPIP